MNVAFRSAKVPVSELDLAPFYPRIAGPAANKTVIS